jgi:hypothetical protein
VFTHPLFACLAFFAREFDRIFFDRSWLHRLQSAP